MRHEDSVPPRDGKTGNGTTTMPLPKSAAHLDLSIRPQWKVARSAKFLRWYSQDVVTAATIAEAKEL